MLIQRITKHKMLVQPVALLIENVVLQPIKRQKNIRTIIYKAESVMIRESNSISLALFLKRQEPLATRMEDNRDL